MTSQVIPSPVVLLEPGAAFLVGAFSQAETVAFHGTGLAFTLAGGVNLRLLDIDTHYAFADYDDKPTLI